MIVISGIGCILPAGTNPQTILSALETEKNCFQPLAEADHLRGKEASLVLEIPLPESLPQGKRRRLSKLSKFFLGAGHLALQDYGLHPWTPEEIGLVISTSHGSIESCQNYHQSLLECPQHVSPMLFSEGGLNAGSSHISIQFNIQGILQSLSGDEEVGAMAILMAHHLLQEAPQKLLLVGGGHEWTRLFHEIYDALSFGKLRLGEGAVLLALETEENARIRQHQPYCQLVDGFSFHQKSIYSKIDSFLKSYELLPEQIDLFISNENGTAKDKTIKEIASLFPKATRFTPLKQFGESFACSSAFLVALGALLLSQKKGGKALIFCESVRGNGIVLLLSAIP